MRLTFFGFELLSIDLDVSIGPSRDEPEPFEPYQDADVIASTPVAYTAPLRPEWCDPGSPHTLDPDEGEDRRTGFVRR